MHVEDDTKAPLLKKGGRRFDFLFGLVGTFLHVGTGIIMLPVIAATLTPSALTFWYVFMTIQTLALLIEFGFTPTLARNFTYVFSGANRLQAEGVPESGGGALNRDLFASLLRASRWLYAGMALIVALLLGVGGTIYLTALARTTTDVAYIWPAWAAFIFALTLQTNFNWQMCVMVGADRMRQDYENFIFARSVQVVLSLAGLYFFPNILTLAVAYAVSVMVSRLHAWLVIRDLLRLGAGVRPDTKAAVGILRTIMPMAAKLGWVTLGEFFTNRFSLFAVSLAIGAAAAAEYAITMQIMIVLLAIAQMGYSLAGPRLASARLTGDSQAVCELYAFCIVFGVALLGVSFAGLIALGEPILRLVGSDTLLPPLPVLILLSAIFLLTTNMQSAMNIITTGNQVPHMRAVLITGIATTLGVIAVAFAEGNLLAFVAVQGVTQLAFNFWRWPVYAFRDSGLTLGSLWGSAIAGGKRVVLGHA